VFTQILWWIGNATEAFILARSIKGKLYEKYPAFYFYLSAVLLVDLLRFAAYTFRPNLHRLLYWYTEYLVAIVGYVVILEIYKHALKSSPGAARIARIFLFGVLGTVILKVMGMRSAVLLGHQRQLRQNSNEICAQSSCCCCLESSHCLLTIGSRLAETSKGSRPDMAFMFLHA